MEPNLRLVKEELRNSRVEYYVNDNDEKHGTLKKYNVHTGHLVLEETYVHGRKHGKKTEYNYRTGNVFREVYLKYGYPYGIETTYYPNSEGWYTKRFYDHFANACDDENRQKTFLVWAQEFDQDRGLFAQRNYHILDYNEKDGINYNYDTYRKVGGEWEMYKGADFCSHSISVTGPPEVSETHKNI